MANSSAQTVAAFPQTETSPEVQIAQTHQRIAALAYLKAEARGFAPGHELDDWLEAENEFNVAGGEGLKH